MTKSVPSRSTDTFRPRPYPRALPILSVTTDITNPWQLIGDALCRSSIVRQIKVHVKGALGYSQFALADAGRRFSNLLKRELKMSLPVVMRGDGKHVFESAQKGSTLGLALLLIAHPMPRAPGTFGRSSRKPSHP